MLPTAIVPLRIGPVTKRRLAHVLGAEQRRRLMQRLFEHVSGVLVEAGLDVVVLSPYPVTVPAGIQVWPDEAPGLNAALDGAVERTGQPVLIVHADLPHIAVDDVNAMLGAPGDVVIARATDGGTNALLMRKRISCAFGKSSALVHATRARAHHLRAYVLDRPGLALDVDDEAALSASSSSPPASSSLRSSTSRRPAP